MNIRWDFQSWKGTLRNGSKPVILSESCKLKQTCVYLVDKDENCLRCCLFSRLQVSPVGNCALRGRHLQEAYISSQLVSMPFTSSSNSSELEFPSYCYLGGGVPNEACSVVSTDSQYCQFDGIEGHWRCKSLRISVRGYFHYVSWGEKTHLKCGKHHPPALGSMLNRKWSGHQVSLFSASRLQMQCVQQPLSPAATPSLP